MIYTSVWFRFVCHFSLFLFPLSKTIVLIKILHIFFYGDRCLKMYSRFILRIYRRVLGQDCPWEACTVWSPLSMLNWIPGSPCHTLQKEELPISNGWQGDEGNIKGVTSFMSLWSYCCQVLHLCKLSLIVRNTCALYWYWNIWTSIHWCGIQFIWDHTI